jgi:F-type H+-transporting ATPase subunit b
LEALGLNLGYLFVQIFNFLIVFVILRAFVYKPLLNMLEKRRTAIAKGLEDARVASEARENAEAEAQKIIAEAQAKATEEVRLASERAEAAGKDILAQAEEDTAKERAAALANAEQERDRILADLRSQVAALAMAAAQRLVGEALDEQRQHSLINEFFSGVKSGKVVVLDNAELQGASAEIVSALPLTDEEKETVRQDILSKTGSQTVTFRVDPSILGGLVVKVGDKVLDGSVSGQLDTLRQSLS